MSAPGSKFALPGSYSPITGEPLDDVQWTAPEAVAGVVQLARTAQPDWAALSLKERIHKLDLFAQTVLERHDEITAIIHMETGKSPAEILLNEVSGIREYAKLAAAEARAALKPVKVKISKVAYPGKKAVIEALPRGVVAIIAPWNYPLSIFFKPLFPALLSGNAVVLKPSEFTPRTGAWLARVAQETLGDVVQIVQGDGQVGAALLETPIDAITFTGSVATGRKVAARAAERLIPSSVELGGKDAAIVLADCHLDRTLAGITQWSLHNCGQNCGAIERLYVEEAIADEFIDRLASLFQKVRVASPQNKKSKDNEDIEKNVDIEKNKNYEISPLQNPAQLAIVEDHIQDALQKGAVLKTGGKRTGHGLGYLPTLLDHCTPDMKVIRDESFGPLLAITRVKNANEAIDAANQSTFGLNGSIWTSDIPRGEALARQLNVGIANVNNHAIAGSMANIPWTGTGDTGPGIAASRFSFATFVRRRTLFVDRSKDPDPWWFPFNADSRELADHLMAFSMGSLTSALKLASTAKRRIKAVKTWARKD